MKELVNGMSNEMWAGYSSRGGQVLNPYGVGGLFVSESSSGSAVEGILIKVAYAFEQTAKHRKYPKLI